ncbi:MAG: BON domain-containing protein [Hyphomicrobiales bacterium]|nr:BON domain-containing protein [Hyphomicrobiales bacterium]
MTDKAKILDKVRAALRSEPRLGPTFSPQRLDIDGEGALLIEGEVRSVAAKKLALERVAALPEVTGVLDRLRVEPKVRMADAEIRDHLRKAFQQEPNFAALEIVERKGERLEMVRDVPDRLLGRIETEVDDGVVTLNGQVPGLASKRLAGLLAWWVPGSRDVINGLAVEPPEEDGPIRIEEAVKIALKKDPFVEASQIRVGVRHTTVRLTGLVPTESERDMAERDAWYIFGVDKVVNDIEVRR